MMENVKRESERRTNDAGLVRREENWRGLSRARLVLTLTPFGQRPLPAARGRGVDGRRTERKSSSSSRSNSQSKIETAKSKRKRKKKRSGWEEVKSKKKRRESRMGGGVVA